MIKVKNITKRYKLYKNQNDRFKEALSLSKKSYHEDFYALNSLSFSIKSGEIVGIIGNNGSGKSTLLKLITGVLTPSSGTISISKKITALLELGAGFNSELTGLENIYLHGSINGYTKDEMQSKVTEIIEFAEIGEFIYQAVKTYSSGMKSRLAFSLAINVDPEILIIDEVLSVGDAAFQRKCFAKIEAFKEQGKTILFVSHSASQVIQLCHRAIWLSKGKKVIEGQSKLVVGLYQKYGAKKDLDFELIRDEYNKKSLPAAKVTKHNDLNPLINPKLKPTSTICYEENGAKISNVKLKNLNYEEVNIIEKGLYYYYTYNIVFENKYDEVNLAMLIKTTSGFQIGGKESSIIKERVLESVEVGKTYSVQWKFKNILNSGTYFFNCGVNTIVNEEKVILHRILDAYMFEVLQDKDDSANNLVDFELKVEINEE